MEAGDIVDIGEGAVVAGRFLGSGRMTGKQEGTEITSCWLTTHPESWHPLERAEEAIMARTNGFNVRRETRPL